MCSSAPVLAVWLVKFPVWRVNVVIAARTRGRRPNLHLPIGASSTQIVESGAQATNFATHLMTVRCWRFTALKRHVVARAYKIVAEGIIFPEFESRDPILLATLHCHANGSTEVETVRGGVVPNCVAVHSGSIRELLVRN